MVYQVLLLSNDLSEIKKIYEICKEYRFSFYFFDKIGSFKDFIIQERIDVAIINQKLVGDPFLLIDQLRDNDVDTSFIFIGEKDSDLIRKIMKKGYFDYLYYDYSTDDIRQSILDSIENKKAYENIKMISYDLERVNQNLIDKAKELEKDREKLKHIINRFQLIETFIRDINLISDVNSIIERLVDYIAKEFKDNKIIGTRIEDYLEYVVASYGIDIKVLRDYSWDLKDIKASPWAESILKGKVRVEVENPLDNIWYSKSTIANILPEGFIKYPIFYGDYVYGTVIVSHDKGRKMSSDDKLFYLKQLVEHASIQIYNKILRDKLTNTIEQLKEYQQQLIEKEKLSTLAKVAVSVNHEINNPLCAISLNAELLKRKYKDDENLQKIVDAILKNVTLINKITNKFANLKKVTFKEYLPGIEMLDLDD
jgi:FixJ family two-component response regulator